MLVGCHGLVWTSDFSVSGLEDVAARTHRAGFDLLEVPLLDPWGFDAPAARRSLARHQLTATLSVGHDESTDISSVSPGAVAQGEKRLLRAVEVASELGASQLVGVLFSVLKRYTAPVTPSGRRQSQDVLGRVADRAAGLGLSLSLEIVNRYETNVINTLADARSYIDEIGRDNIRMHIDSFHMNIEEHDMYTPIIAAAGRVGYAHVSENTRGYLGSGGVDFDSFFRGLAAIGYDGPVTFESFSPDLLDPQLSGILALWRKFYDDVDDLARHACDFIRNHVHAAETIS